jgi:hypothetical protein
MVSKKSGSLAHAAEQSITQAGAIDLLISMVSTELLGKSLPEIQWMGASKWAPVCSLMLIWFQYHAGPRSS